MRTKTRIKVLNAANGELQARHLLCFPLFAKWQDDLPNGHHLKPISEDSEKL